MCESGQLAVFVGMVAVLVIVPGPNTVLILGNSLAGGRSAGLATVLGVETGTAVHTAAAALGVSSVLASSAAAFTVLKYAGAAYLIYMGLQAFVGPHRALGEPSPEGHARLGPAFRRAAVANVLNPKVAVFFLALLPQFVNPERGHLVLQFTVLGAIVSAVGLTFGSLLALVAARMRGWLRREAIARWQGRMTGGVLVALGVQLALTGAD